MDSEFIVSFMRTATLYALIFVSIPNLIFFFFILLLNAYAQHENKNENGQV